MMLKPNFHFTYHVILLILLCLPSWGIAQSFHLILVSDTNDPSIGSGCAKNHESLMNLSEQIAEGANLDLNLIQLSGEELESKRLKKELNDLVLEEKDVVWFYYSGHGKNDNKSQWPTLLLPGYDQINLANIHELLSSKEARLTMVMADCCNYVDHSDYSTLQAKAPLNPDACRRLFYEATGSILISSSQRGELSTYFHNVGGLFTSSLVDVLSESLRQRQLTNVSWQNVFPKVEAATDEICAYFNKTQHPQAHGISEVRYADEFGINPHSTALSSFPEDKINTVQDGSFVYKLDGDEPFTEVLDHIVQFHNTRSKEMISDLDKFQYIPMIVQSNQHIDLARHIQYKEVICYYEQEDPTLKEVEIGPDDQGTGWLHFSRKYLYEWLSYSTKERMFLLAYWNQIGVMVPNKKIYFQLIKPQY